MKRNYILSKIIFLSAFLLFSAGVPDLFAVQPLKDGAFYLNQIENRYKNVFNFRAKFVQISKATGVVKTERASGIVYLRKDGKFRWDYDKPEIVIIVSDGETLWIYQAEDKQVMLDTSFGSKMKRFPYTFLKGMENLHKDFGATIVKASKPTITLELIPKEQLKEIKKMMLTFDEHTLLVHEIRWISSQGVETTITFNDIDITSKIPDSVFHFEPPEGVDIVRTDTP